MPTAGLLHEGALHIDAKLNDDGLAAVEDFLKWHVNWPKL